jgi:phage portal protein BeeE
LQTILFIFGKTLSMSWISNIISPLFSPRKIGNVWFYPTSGDTYRALEYQATFALIPEVNAVINLIARAHSNGILKTVNDKGEIVSTPLDNILKNPNWFQAQKEWLRQTELFHSIYGNEYIYTLTPLGFNPDVTKVKALYSLPPNITKVEYLSNTPFYLQDKQPSEVKYFVTGQDGMDKEIDSKLIIHLNDNRVVIKNATDKDMLMGESKLKALTAPINNIRMAYESRGVILKYRGAKGILSPKGKDGIGQSISMLKPSKDSLQEAYRSYGLMGDQSQLVIADMELGWQKIEESDPVKLGLFKEVEESFRKIKDAYGVPATLLDRDKNTTFDNQKEGEKSFYINTVIPAANERAYAMNQKFFPDGKIKIIADFSHLEIFQTDLKAKSDVFNNMVNGLSKSYQDGAITIEEYQSELQKIGIGQ